jgi:UDP-N-acetylmuramate--alanine ligase
MTGGVKVFDDYAHHPTEVKATLQALREKFPKQKIAVCFEPHQQRRLTSLYKEFVNSWVDANYVLLADVYNPKGRDEISKTKNSESLARDINRLPSSCELGVVSRELPKAIYVGPGKNIRSAVAKLPLKKGDVLVMMGAGSIADITPTLFK